MEPLNIRETLKEAVEEIRRLPAVRRHKNISYALAVKVGYEDIQMLRNDGYSYNLICEVFAAKGVLGADASPKNLCIAFLRETKRRNRNTQRAEQKSHTTAEKTSPAITNAGQTSQSKVGEPKKPDAGGEAEKEDAARKKAALGNCTKRMDGGLDFNF